MRQWDSETVRQWDSEGVMKTRIAVLCSLVVLSACSAPAITDTGAIQTAAVQTAIAEITAQPTQVAQPSPSSPPAGQPLPKGTLAPGQTQPAPPQAKGTLTPALTLTLAKKTALTTEAEGGSARPEMIAAQNRVFVAYLGNIGQRDGRTFNAKIFDANLDNVIAKKTLVQTTPEYGGPTDIRVASDDKFLFAFYETHKPTSQTTGVTYLWGAKYALDDKFERVAYTAQPITTSKPLAELSDGGELLDDPAPLVGPNSVFVATRLKFTAAKSGKTIYRVREFNKDTLAKLSEFDLNLSDAIDGRARVASLLYRDNSIYIVLATTTSDQVTVENDDGAQSNLAVVRMKSDWTFDAQKDVRTISAAPDDVENYVSGLDADGNYFYITYKQSVGKPPTGEHRAWIKIFDRDWNLVQQQQVKTAPWGPSGGEIRPSVEVIGNRILSGQSGGQGVGRGSAEIYVYQTSLPAPAPTAESVAPVPKPPPWNPPNVTTQQLLDNARKANTQRYQFAMDRGARVVPTDDGRSFSLLWYPNASAQTHPPMIATLSGHGSYAFDEFFLWQPFAQQRGYGIIALQWWFTTGEKLDDYYTPERVYEIFAAILREQKIAPGKTLLHGFSRGSANIYGVTLYDRLSRNNLFGLTIANAGKASPDFPPNPDINAGKYGQSVFAGTRWAMYCGGKDPNPNRDGCVGMREAREWVQKFGGTVDLLIEDAQGDHGGFHRDAKNVNAALDVFQKILNSKP